MLPLNRKPPTMRGDWVLTIKNVLFPQFCGICGYRLLTEENGYFCPTCWDLSPRVQRPFCSVCGRPHAGAIGFGDLSNFPCTDCREQKARGALRFRRMYGAALYDGAVKEAIKLLKFYKKRRLARPLGQLMTDFAAREMDCQAYDFIVPVPLHDIRERDRGFNQSRLLAEAVLPAFPNAQMDDSLLRIRPTCVQSRLKTAEERRANVIGAFAVLGNRLAGSRVLLMDDVVTTSGTVSECAAALCRASVASVDVLAAALRSPADTEFDGVRTRIPGPGSMAKVT